MKITNKILIPIISTILLVGCNNMNTEKSTINELSSTLFSSEINTPSNVGLIDSNVGVNESKFYNEILYSSENLNIDLTINASDFNVNGNDKNDDTLALIQAIEKVKSYNGTKNIKLLLPKGNLDFIEKINPLDRGCGIVLEDLKNVVIAGQDTTLYFHSEVQAIKIINCENLYFENLNIDYGIPPFSVGVIHENDGQTFKVKVNEGYVVNEKTVVAAFLEYNKTSFTPRSKGNDIYGDVKNVTYLGNNELEITFNRKYNVAPEGTLVILRHYLYEYDGFFINESKNVYFESINLYTCPGMGVRAYTTENMYFNRFNVKLKPQTDRLMSVTADALHFIDCYGDLKVTNSLFENCGDDALNSHGAYLQITSIDDNYSFSAINPRSYNFMPRIGDKLEVNKRTDLTLIQELTVKSVEKLLTGGFKITCEEVISENVEIGQVVGNATKLTKLRFINNIVRNKRCRGVLVQSRDTIIENNTFANLSDAGILVTADANNWYESITSQDCIIRNNKFLKNNYGVGNTYGDIAITSYGENYNYASVGTLKNFEITNNFFGNGANGAIHASSINGLKIYNNCIYNPGLSPKVKNANMAISLSNSENIEICNNRIYENSSKDFKSIIIGGGINSEKILLINNIGIDKSSISSESLFKTFNILKTDISDLMDGKDLSKWSTITNNLELYGFNDVDLNEIEMDDSTFKLNELKMVYDDQGIYIGFDVDDDELIYNSSQYWEADGVEIFITSEVESLDPLNIIKLSTNDTLEIFMNNNTTVNNQLVELRTSTNVYSKQSEFIVKFNEKDNIKGYYGKVFIPFSVVPTIEKNLKEGKEFAFCINFIDLDSYGIRRQYATCPSVVEYNKYVPAKMSKIKVG